MPKGAKTFARQEKKRERERGRERKRERDKERKRERERERKRERERERERARGLYQHYPHSLSKLRQDRKSTCEDCKCSPPACPHPSLFESDLEKQKERDRQRKHLDKKKSPR